MASERLVCRFVTCLGSLELRLCAHLIEDLRHQPHSLKASEHGVGLRVVGCLFHALMELLFVFPYLVRKS